MINQEYFLGLDIGTDSVGWAAANSEYHIIKKMEKRYGACDYLIVHRQPLKDVSTVSHGAVLSAGSSALPGCRTNLRRKLRKKILRSFGAFKRVSS